MASLELVTNLSVGALEVKNFNDIKAELTESLNKYKSFFVVENEKEKDNLERLITEFKVDNDLLKLGGTPLTTKEVYEKQFKDLGITDTTFVFAENPVFPIILSLNEAKNQKAALNKASKAFNDRRIALEKEYMQPFNVGKGQVAELVGMIKEASTSLDSQVNSYEMAFADAKREQITNIFNKINIIQGLTLSNIWNESWLNKTCKLETIEEDITLAIARVSTDLYAIETMSQMDTALKHIGLNEYWKNLSLQDAVASMNKYHADTQTTSEVATSDLKVYSMTITILGNKLKLEAIKSFLDLNKYDYSIARGENDD